MAGSGQEVWALVPFLTACVLSLKFGGPGSDADGDGDSDGNDFLIWQRNLESSSVATAHAVPEPCTLAPTAIIWPAVLTMKRSRQRRRGTPQSKQEMLHPPIPVSIRRLSTSA